MKRAAWPLSSAPGPRPSALPTPASPVPETPDWQSASPSRWKGRLISRRTSRTLVLLCCVSPLVSPRPGTAQATPTFVLEIEAGPVWQSRNEVQIPNDDTGTRFSLADVAGHGPWPAGRLYLTWNINRRHGVTALLAPLSFTETGILDAPVAFAGRTFEAGQPVEATYRFNSWRLRYSYRFLDRDRLDLWVGFTAKLRDAKIELEQGGASAEDTDLGFVPLLHLAADQKIGEAWHVLFDFDGLAGGPGRAFDAALKVAYDIGDSWGIGLGYRTLEGGADVESVYNFAWLHFAVVSGEYRF